MLLCVLCHLYVDMLNVDMFVADDDLSGRSRCVSLLLEWCKVVCALYNLKVPVMQSLLVSLSLLVVYCSKMSTMRLSFKHTHNCLTALFQDYPGEPVPER